jgi:hypothetical protein
VKQLGSDLGQPPRVELPRIELPRRDLFLVVIGIIISAIGVFFQVPLFWRAALIILGVLFIFYIITKVIVFGWRFVAAIQTLKQRIDQLYDYAARINNELVRQKATNSDLVRAIAAILYLPRFPIVDVVKRGDKLLIEVDESQSLLRRLHIGSRLVVFDPRNNITMGTFIVVEATTAGWFADAVYINNGLWWTAMRDYAEKSLRPQTHAIAVSVPKDGE